MSVDAAAELVARGDPERFRAAMTAALAVRGDLLVLYAFNLELARSSWVASDPLIADMRLQFWADILEEVSSGGAVRPHEVATPLADVVRRHGLPRTLLDAMVSSRRREMAPVETLETVQTYVQDTAGGLLRLAAQVASGGTAADAAASAAGAGHGMAAYLLALPALAASGRQALPIGGEAGDVRSLAAWGRGRLSAARALAVAPAARPAFRTNPTADLVLARAERAPHRAMDDTLAPSEFRRRAVFLRTTLFGSW
ncbi:MAG: squalene/phytoene synthase family protein [Pseudomonadota bacterium]